MLDKHRRFARPEWPFAVASHVVCGQNKAIISLYLDWFHGKSVLFHNEFHLKVLVLGHDRGGKCRNTECFKHV